MGHGSAYCPTVNPWDYAGTQVFSKLLRPTKRTCFMPVLEPDARIPNSSTVFLSAVCVFLPSNTSSSLRTATTTVHHVHGSCLV